MLEAIGTMKYVNQKKILIVFGTRPEAIKMAPLVKALLEDDNFVVKVCVTAQHRQLLDMILSFFDIRPDYDLNLMKTNQSLASLSADILCGMDEIIGEFNPDMVLVHGDTSTSTFAALAAFYRKVPVGHVEAGLRTYQRYAPFPEEINRQLTGRIAEIHFSPTTGAKDNLIHEGVDASTIFVTGNTVIDALLWARERLKVYRDMQINTLESLFDSTKKLILVTAHRRESFGRGMEEICNALELLAERDDVEILFPVHPNPNVRDLVYARLEKMDHVHLIEPLGYPAFAWLMIQAYLVITDSGGIQEEAPSLGKPVLVLRDVSERPEAIIAGGVILVGTNAKKIVREATALLDVESRYLAMASTQSPYGDGHSAPRVVSAIKSFLNL